MARVAVVGAGVGGLTASIRLRAQGHDVSVFERRRAGGKLGSLEIDGFTFDTGPSLLTLPDVFTELFSAAGEDLSDYITLRRLQHPYRHAFHDGAILDGFDDVGLSRESFAQFTDGMRSFDAMTEHTARVWDTSVRTFFTGPMESPLSLLRRMDSPRDLLAVDALRTLDSRSRTLFNDPRLRAWLNRFATYSGSSPFLAPATLSCVAHVEQVFGAWHVMGGLGRLADALVSLASKAGVRYHEADVSRITSKAGRVTGIVADGEHFDCEVVVCNANAEQLFSDLFPAPNKLRRARRAGRSSSVFAMMLGVEGQSEGLTHHNVWYSHDQRAEFKEIFGGSGVPSAPTVYVCNPSVTDAALAPPGCESWFVLVNVGAGASANWDEFSDAIIARLGVAGRVRVRRQVTPSDLESEFSDPGGAIYGTSSNSRRSAFLRASNRGPVGGLYLCSGSSHPGGGLPLVAMSGRIVADMVTKDFAQ